MDVSSIYAKSPKYSNITSVNYFNLLKILHEFLEQSYSSLCLFFFIELSFLTGLLQNGLLKDTLKQLRYIFCKIKIITLSQTKDTAFTTINRSLLQSADSFLFVKNQGTFIATRIFLNKKLNDINVLIVGSTQPLG